MLQAGTWHWYFSQGATAQSWNQYRRIALLHDLFGIKIHRHFCRFRVGLARENVSCRYFIGL
jgi:hypothetical protein